MLQGEGRQGSTLLYTHCGVFFTHNEEQNFSLYLHTLSAWQWIHRYIQVKKKKDCNRRTYLGRHWGNHWKLVLLLIEMESHFSGSPRANSQVCKKKQPNSSLLLSSWPTNLPLSFFLLLSSLFSSLLAFYWFQGCFVTYRKSPLDNVLQCIYPSAPFLLIKRSKHDQTGIPLAF